MTPKRQTRSLQPPPSLAARFGSTPPAAQERASSGSQRAALQEIAKELREILDMLNEGDAKVASTRAKRR